MADLTRKTANLFDYKTVYDSYLQPNGDIIANTGVTSSTLNSLANYIGKTITISVYCKEINSSRLQLQASINGAAKTGNNIYQGETGYTVLTVTPETANDWWNLTYGVGGTNTLNQFMVSESSSYVPYEPYGWVHSLRKLTTATEAIENPLYSDGTAINTYTIKGNTVQDGTPTPSNPVEVQGVGNKTANLLGYNRQRSNSFTTDENYYIYGGAANSTNTDTSPSNVSISISDNTISVYSRNGSGIGYIVEVQPNTTYTLSFDSDLTLPNKTYAALNLLTEGLQFGTLQTVYDKTYSFTTDNTTKYVYIVFRVVAETCVYSNIMLNTGNTALPYEHYGYKIPILNNSQTIDIYIGDLPLLKSLDGTAVDEISNGTLTRRVDSDGSVLPTPTTTQITMPTIPTTEGANSITVDTTVQPSEFTATWTGWHNASVKEYDGSDWQ